MASLEPVMCHVDPVTCFVKGVAATSPDALTDEDFYRWRPRCHLMPNRHWINDPCGPCYSPSNGGYYHIAFQWNPYSWEWANMSWGHALSRDMVNWQVSSQPALEPCGDQDPCGVYTGCVWPTDPQGRAGSTLTSFYTSTQRTPIHWTLPYLKGSEMVRMATSEDQGRTWKRSLISSLLSGPPEEVDVTGWRDPFVGPWESIDKCLERKAGEYLYGVIAGGIRQSSPTIFLYSIDAHELTQWSYLGMPFAPGTNFAPSPSLPDFGTNFEVTNFMTLQDNLGNGHDILIMGVEGILPRPEALPLQSSRHGDRPTRTQRINRAQNWLCAQVNKQAHEPSLK